MRFRRFPISPIVLFFNDLFHHVDIPFERMRSWERLVDGGLAEHVGDIIVKLGDEQLGENYQGLDEIS